MYGAGQLFNLNITTRQGEYHRTAILQSRLDGKLLSMRVEGGRGENVSRFLTGPVEQPFVSSFVYQPRCTASATLVRPQISMT
jgi:hypothetical protein